MIDLHSHILPGIDDGARTYEDSVTLVRELSLQGVTKMVATPHYVDESIYTSPRARNLELIEELSARLGEAGVAMELTLGNEIYINGRILELIAAGEISSMADSEYVLVELPMSGDYPNYEEILRALIRAGRKVILAHPERYESFQKDFALIEELFDMGVLLQSNIGSITGQYGKAAQKTMKNLAKRKMVFGFGTDIHHPHGESWVMDAKKKLRKYYSDAELEEVLVGGPSKIFLGS